jgi:hypothetical protein
MGSEYQGDAENSVTELGFTGRTLSPSEKLRLGYLTGQRETPEAEAKSGFFYGVDPDYPDVQECE